MNSRYANEQAELHFKLYLTNFLMKSLGRTIRKQCIISYFDKRNRSDI